ncbi:hypothetical protein [Methylocystis bryophila]|uniref:hypothetical protein n=1 Tax=Methylocystis bryophila TaxID=655015 RepID=UPI001319DD8A|nr:hypothetical protein [Methylocystis bryophila]
MRRDFAHNGCIAQSIDLLTSIFRCKILNFARRQTAVAARINFVRRSGDSLTAEGVKDFSKLQRDL